MKGQDKSNGGNLVAHPIDDGVAKANSLVESQRNFLRRLFPDERERALRKSQLAQARSILEFREQALRLAKDARLQSMREVLNQQLDSLKIGHRKQRAEFFSQQAMDLENEIDAKVEEMIRRMEAARERTERWKTPFVRELDEKRIDSRIGTFIESMDQLIQDFYSILDEKVQL